MIIWSLLPPALAFHLTAAAAPTKDSQEASRAPMADHTTTAQKPYPASAKARCSQAGTTPGPVISTTLQQTNLAFLSNTVSAAGAGLGVGLQASWKKRWVGHVDVSLLWLMGNVVATRVGLGYVLVAHPTYSPTVWLTGATLWGSRIEQLRPDGARQPVPAWAVGARVSALRFEVNNTTLSALEFGLGSNPQGALFAELSLLQAALQW